MLLEATLSGKSIFAVSVDGDNYGEPELLFRTDYWVATGLDGFDVTPDGERFLIVERIGRPDSLMLIQNWTELLER